MPELVINTGPVIALTAALGDLSVLDVLYERVVIPQEVFRELESGGVQSTEIELLRRLSSVEFVPEATLLPSLLEAELDPGEASVIQTAVNREILLVAIDEKQGRRIARLNQRKVTGSIGILMKGHRVGCVQDVLACLGKMRNSGVWISDNLEAAVRAELDGY